MVLDKKFLIYLYVKTSIILSTADKILSYLGLAFLLAALLTGGKSINARNRMTGLPATDTLTICVCGDIMMHIGQIQKADKGNGIHDFKGCFRHIKGLVESADISIANMEFPMAGSPYAGYPEFSAPEQIGHDVAEAGFDVMLAANNHIFDKGSKGAAKTLEIYRQLKEKYGTGMAGLSADQEDFDRTTPLRIERKGIQVALLNMTYGTNRGADLHWPKTLYISQKETIKKALQRAENADLTIALPHWGTEYVLEHSASQEQTATWLAENGADVIIGSHPHVIQDTQTLQVGRKKVNVAYSLGNVLSNMSAKNTQLGLIAWLRITRNDTGEIDILPLEFTYIWCSRPGGFDNGYTVIPVGDFIGKRHLWQGGWDYDKMMATLERVMNETGIKDKNIL